MPSDVTYVDEHADDMAKKAENVKHLVGTETNKPPLVEARLAHKRRKPGGVDEPDGREVPAMRCGKAAPSELGTGDELQPEGNLAEVLVRASRGLGLCFTGEHDGDGDCRERVERTGVPARVCLRLHVVRPEAVLRG